MKLVPKLQQHLIPFLITTLLVIGSVEICVWQTQKYLKSGKQSLQPQITSKSTQKKKTHPVSSPEKIAEQFKKIITQRQLFGYPVNIPGKQQELNLPAITANDLQVLLMGTIGTDSSNSRAIIMDQTDKSQNIYKKGDFVQGVKIKEILRQRVILAVDGQDKILEMNESISYTPQTQAPAPGKKTVSKARKTRGITN